MKKMAPNNQGYLVNGQEPEPVSRTYQYRKVMKPMLERKRRARINRCLDELKEIMMVALQTEGEHVAKLEKADILELTVRHLQKLRHQNQLTVRPEQTYIDRFRAGFKHCASEVTQFLGTVDQNTSTNIVKHLNSCIRRLDGMQPLKEVTPMPARPKNTQTISPVNFQTNYNYQMINYHQHFNGNIPINSSQHQHQLISPTTSPTPMDPCQMWRPW